MIISRIRYRILGPFRSDTRGVAAVEFAFIMPIIVALWLGATELSFAVSTDRRIARAANGVADITARLRMVNDDIMDGIFEGGLAMTFPDGQNGEVEIVASSIEIDADGGTSVRKSWVTDGGTALASGAAVDIGDGLAIPGEGGCAIVATATLTKPVFLLPKLFGETRTHTHTFAYRTRSGVCLG